MALLAPLVVARKGYYTDLAAWAAKQGLRAACASTARRRRPRPGRAWTASASTRSSCRSPSWRSRRAPRPRCAPASQSALGYGKGVVHVLPAGATAPEVFSTRRACPSCGRGFPEPDPRLFSYNSKHGWCPACYGTGLAIEGFDAEQTGEEIWWNEWYEGAERACPACDGRRLRPEALAVRFAGRAHRRGPRAPRRRGRGVRRRADARRARGGDRPRPAGRDRAPGSRSCAASASPTSRSTAPRPTLSGGEAQRIRLAAQLGSNLRGVCYILDEPTIGLHARDNRLLLETLQGARESGNTVVVVEHDEETIRAAEHVDRPRAGRRGQRRARGRRRDAAGPAALAGVGDRAVPARAAAPPARRGRRAPGRGRLGTDRGARRAACTTCATSPWRSRSGGWSASPGSAAAARARWSATCSTRTCGGSSSSGAARPRGPRAAPREIRPDAPGASGRAARLRRDRRLGAAPARPRGRPDADRQDAALLPGDLRRLLGRRAPPLRGHAGGEDARLRAGPLLLQRRGRPLRGLRGAGGAAHRDELPPRRDGALRRLPRRALRPRDAGGALSRAHGRRGARDERRRGGGLLRGPPAGAQRAAPAPGRRARLPDPRAALAHR